MRVLRRLLLPLVALASAAITAVFLQPSWYGAAEPGPCTEGSPADRAARELEGRVTVESHRIRPAGAEWELELAATEVNAFIACRLGQWAGFDPTLESMGAFEGVRVRLGQGEIRVGKAAGPSILSLDLAPSASADAISLRAAGGSIGLLPLGGWLARLVLPADLADALLPAQFPLADGRRVEVLGVTVGEGTLLLRLRTLPRE